MSYYNTFHRRQRGAYNLKSITMKGYYRHKKGNLYRVLYEAKDSETCEALIVYQAMYGKGEVWVRPRG